MPRTPEHLGPQGYCVCVKCGRRFPHRRGIRCTEERCPVCGSALLREGSSHHKAALAKKKQKEERAKAEREGKAETEAKAGTEAKAEEATETG